MPSRMTRSEIAGERMGVKINNAVPIVSLVGTDRKRRVYIYGKCE